ncbi:hypothetical protein C7Y70_17165 [Pseudoalteromonas sp. KS88]|uniref:carbohydrate binding family 9 domain-containing protein n=1 Tax=Pseudoalteromonas sp. KS88 TaxID=2109918 RepID=UPI001080E5AF|nr:carbohydrate binding family 9 domain-containing protein [Pseudoalteromonas sp. KS88]TGE78100.1 hypothetical protein C7Y70_17165 [Pseudoalteromonas sp. KS88]
MYKSIICAAFISASFNAISATQPIKLPYIPQSATVDGKLDEPSWKQARKIVIDNVTWPYENTKSPVNTNVYVYENGETLFIGFDAQDSNPEDIRAFYRDRDAAWDDDLVGLKIDSYNNSQLAYQFFINPLGVQQDSIENELTKSESSSWDGIWDSVGIIHENGYTVEVAIPLRVLNFDDSIANKTMAMEFLRFLPRSERLRISSMQIDHGNNCWICQMPSYIGFEQAKQGNNVAVIPSVVTGKSENRDIDATEVGEWQADQNTEVSLDVKWGITPDITLNATINPDFSQVEADVAQLSVNNNFSLFFPEKRAFFLDNADYFASTLNLIHTRNIAEPDYGTKITGSKNGHTFAGFVANDSQTNVLIPGNLGSSLVSFDSKSENAALRYRYDFASALSLGSTITHRQSDDYQNSVLSIDGKFKPTVNDTFLLQVLKSDTQYSDEFINELCDGESCLDADPEPCEINQDCDFNEGVLRVLNQHKQSGTGYFVKYEHDEKYWRAFADYQYRDADLRADLGFISQVDFQKFTTGGEYRWYGEKHNWWNRANWYADWDITHNENNELLEKEAQTSFSVNGPLQSYFELSMEHRNRTGLRHDKSRLDIDNNTDLFSENGIGLYSNFKPKAGLFASLYMYTGNAVDLANNRVGNKLRIRPILNMNLGKHFEIRLRHTYEKLDANGRDVFTANLSDVRLTYQFNVNSFLRLAVIYTDLERNKSNYIEDVDSQYKKLATQLLYSYKLNPQTVFFAGYSDTGYQDDELSSITKEQRTLFAKFSYAWLL